MVEVEYSMDFTEPLNSGNSVGLDTLLLAGRANLTLGVRHRRKMFSSKLPYKVLSTWRAPYLLLERAHTYNKSMWKHLLIGLRGAVNSVRAKLPFPST